MRFVKIKKFVPFTSRSIIIAVLFGLTGLITILLTQAAVPRSWFEAESAATSGQVSEISDETASNGSALEFGGTPTAGDDCALPKYPTLACTGVPPGTTLTTSSGDLFVTTPGQVIESRRVTGNLIVSANNVIIRNSEVLGAIMGNHTKPMFTVEDSTIGPTSGCQTMYSAISDGNYTARRVYVRNTGDAFRVSKPGNVLIEDSFTVLCSVTGAHSDGVQGYIGGNNVIIRHNTIDQRPAVPDATSPIFFADNSESAIVRNNLLIGGGYTLRFHDAWTPDHGPWEATGNRIVDKAWEYGPKSLSGTNCATTTWSDNRLVTIDENYNILTVGAEVSCSD